MSRFFPVLIAGLVFSLAVTIAQQPPQPPPAQPAGQPAAGGANAPPKPLVPVVASTVAANPDAYVGEFVSLTATVDQNLTKTTFSVDQDRTKSEKDVLIIAPTLQKSVDQNAYVTVLGELIKFDPEEVKKKAKNYTLDLPPDLIAKYKGKPTVVATAVVVNATGIDVAKLPPPPMTADDLALQVIMKQVGPANTALRAALDKMDVATAKEQAAILAKTFAQTEAFWKPKGKADASNFAAEGKKHVDTINTALSAGKVDDAKAAAGPLAQQCAGCHGAYRERIEDGTYRIKLSK